MNDDDQPVAANLLNREFTAAAPTQRWVGDTTEFVIAGSGPLYLIPTRAAPTRARITEAPSRAMASHAA